MLLYATQLKHLTLALSHACNVRWIVLCLTQSFLWERQEREIVNRASRKIVLEHSTHTHIRAERDNAGTLELLLLHFLWYETELKSLFCAFCLAELPSLYILRTFANSFGKSKSYRHCHFNARCSSRPPTRSEKTKKFPANAIKIIQ